MWNGAITYGNFLAIIIVLGIIAVVILGGLLIVIGMIVFDQRRNG